MTVLKFDQKKWNDMRFLQDDIKFMKSKNIDGKWNDAIENESKMLRQAIRSAA